MASLASVCGPSLPLPLVPLNAALSGNRWHSVICFEDLLRIEALRASGPMLMGLSARGDFALRQSAFCNDAHISLCVDRAARSIPKGGKTAMLKSGFGKSVTSVTSVTSPGPGVSQGLGDSLPFDDPRAWGWSPAPGLGLDVANVDGPARSIPGPGPRSYATQCPGWQARAGLDPGRPRCRPGFALDPQVEGPGIVHQLRASMSPGPGPDRLLWAILSAKAGIVASG